MMTLLTRDGRPSLVPACMYPLTGVTSLLGVPLVDGTTGAES
jgi:hypothetical protein